MTRRRLAALAVAVLAVLVATRLPGRGLVADAADALAESRWSDAAVSLAQARADAALPPSATALYDEGLAWYHAGDLPRALAAWRAARELAPRDADLVHNLAQARSELTGAATPVGMAQPWMEVVTPGEVGLVALLLWVVATRWGWAWRRQGQPVGPFVGAVVVALLLSGLAMLGRDARLHAPVGVTLEDAVARDAASLQGGQRFVLPTGSEVRAHARSGPFVLVEDGKGRRGWVLTDAVALPDARQLR